MKFSGSRQTPGTRLCPQRVPTPRGRHPGMGTEAGVLHTRLEEQRPPRVLRALASEPCPHTHTTSPDASCLGSVSSIQSFLSLTPPQLCWPPAPSLHPTLEAGTTGRPHPIPQRPRPVWRSVWSWRRENVLGEAGEHGVGRAGTPAQTASQRGPRK